MQVSHWGSYWLSVNQSPMPFHLLQIALLVLVCFSLAGTEKWCLPLSLLWDLVVISSCWIQPCVQVTLLWDESSVTLIAPGMLGKASKVYGPEEGCSTLPFTAGTVEQPCDDHDAIVTKINSVNHFWCLFSYPSAFCWNINWPSEKQVLTDKQTMILQGLLVSGRCISPWAILNGVTDKYTVLHYHLCSSSLSILMLVDFILVKDFSKFMEICYFCH